VIGAAGDEGIKGGRVTARGIEASPDVGRTDIVPGTRAETQSTVSGRGGLFTLRGLSPGLYQLDAVAPGLVTIPASVRVSGAGWVLDMGRRSVIARAGADSAAVTLRVEPVAVVIVGRESSTGVQGRFVTPALRVYTTS